MNNVKRSLLQEIEEKIKRKMELREKIAQRNQLDTFVLSFISNVEEISESIHDRDAWNDMVDLALSSLDTSVKSIDNHANISISWQEVESMHPQVNGVLVKWSKSHQTKNSCEPELFVDITSLLFK